MALAVLCAVQFMLVLDVSVVNVVLASIQDHLGIAPPTSTGSSPPARWRSAGC